MPARPPDRSRRRVCSGRSGRRQFLGTVLKNAAQPPWRQRTVFTIVRRFRLARGSAGEIARRVNESFVPLLQKLPGFREYLLEDGPDVLVSIRVFDSADEALASNEIAANWMRDNVLEFVKGMPEVMAGNVLIAESKRASSAPAEAASQAAKLENPEGGEARSRARVGRPGL
jgi:hypothetical protein